MKIVQKEIKFIAPEIDENIEFSFVLDWQHRDGNLFANGASCASLDWDDTAGVWFVCNHASDTEDRYRSPVIDTLPIGHEFPDIFAKAIHTLRVYVDKGWRRKCFEDENLERLGPFSADL